MITVFDLIFTFDTVDRLIEQSQINPVELLDKTHVVALRSSFIIFTHKFIHFIICFFVPVYIHTEVCVNIGAFLCVRIHFSIR